MSEKAVAAKVAAQIQAAKRASERKSRVSSATLVPEKDGAVLAWIGDYFGMNDSEWLIFSSAYLSMYKLITSSGGSPKDALAVKNARIKETFIRAVDAIYANLGSGKPASNEQINDVFGVISSAYRVILDGEKLREYSQQDGAVMECLAHIFLIGIRKYSSVADKMEVLSPGIEKKFESDVEAAAGELKPEGDWNANTLKKYIEKFEWWRHVEGAAGTSTRYRQFERMSAAAQRQSSSGEPAPSASSKIPAPISSGEPAPSASGTHPMEKGTTDLEYEHSDKVSLAIDGETPPKPAPPPPIKPGRAGVVFDLLGLNFSRRKSGKAPLGLNQITTLYVVFTNLNRSGKNNKDTIARMMMMLVEAIDSGKNFTRECDEITELFQQGRNFTFEIKSRISELYGSLGLKNKRLVPPPQTHTRIELVNWLKGLSEKITDDVRLKRLLAQNATLFGVGIVDQEVEKDLWRIKNRGGTNTAKEIKELFSTNAGSLICLSLMKKWELGGFYENDLGGYEINPNWADLYANVATRLELGGSDDKDHKSMISYIVAMHLCDFSKVVEYCRSDQETLQMKTGNCYNYVRNVFFPKPLPVERNKLYVNELRLALDSKQKVKLLDLTRTRVLDLFESFKNFTDTA